LRTWLRRSLWEVVPRDQRDSPHALRRRQVVTIAFVVVGASVLGVSLRIEPGSGWFYPATLGLAAVWALGAIASGPVHLGRIAYADRQVRPVLTPIVLGLVLAMVFVVGGLVVRQIDRLEREVSGVADFAEQGSLPILVVVTAVNGVAEEFFFRGAVYAAITRHPVAWTTLAYAVATAASGTIMLALSAALLGLVVGLQRRASGGILAPILTHVTWSLSMLLALPVLFGG